MNDALMPVSEYEGKKVVFARDLKAFLDDKSEFYNWRQSIFSKYGFVENRDYQIVSRDEFGNLTNKSYRIRGGELLFTVEAAKKIVEGANIYLSPGWSESDLEAALQRISACRWAAIPYPNLKYPSYVSENGEVCVVYLSKTDCAKKSGKVLKKARRLNGYYLATNETPSRKYFDVGKCVYLSFKVGEWIDDIEIQYIDNDIYNCCLSNLEEKKKEEINTDLLYKYIDNYIQWFDVLVGKIAYIYKRPEDAFDIVQDSFISTAQLCNNTHKFNSLWFIIAKNFALQCLRKDIVRQNYNNRVTQIVRDYIILSNS
jgi:phage anti-repressor protein